jgi:hypothetical protein
MGSVAKIMLGYGNDSIEIRHMPSALDDDALNYSLRLCL